MASRSVYIVGGCIFIILVGLSTTEVSSLLHTKETIVTGIYNQTASIGFTVNFTGYPNRALKSFGITIPPSEDKIALLVNEELVVLKSLEPYRERLSGLGSGNEYQLLISKLEFTDENTFQLELIYEDSKNDTIDHLNRTQTDVQLIIKGGPHHCGPVLPSILNFDMDIQNFINITLCGNEKPLVVFTLDGNELTLLESYNTTNKYEYVYNLTIPQGDQSICGKQLRYLATGYEADLSQSTTIDVIFEPIVTIIDASITSNYQQNNCVLVSWNAIDIGNCSGLQYEIQLIKSDNNTITIPVVNQTITSLSHCVENFTDILNVTKVKVRGIFKLNVGNWTEQTVAFPTTTTTTTTTATTTTTTTTTATSTKGGFKSGNDDDNDIYIIVGAAVGGCVFLILLILIIICCCCKKKKKQKEQIRSMHMDSIDEFDYKKVDEKQKVDENQIEDENKNLNEKKENKNSESKFKVPPASTIHHPSKIVNNYGTPQPPLAPDTTINIEEENKAKLENTQESTDQDIDDEPHEVVSAAQLRFYDPTEFNLPPLQGQQDEINTPICENKPSEGERSLQFTNEGYGKDEFESDDDEHDYENYHDNYKADQLPQDAFEHFNEQKT